MSAEKYSGEPFLYSKSISRKGAAPQLPGRFSKHENVWMVLEAGKEVPLIRYSRSLSELATKTEARPERDDQSSPGMLEAITKTANPGERTDEEYGLLLELQTKTATKAERDDR